MPIKTGRSTSAGNNGITGFAESGLPGALADSTRDFGAAALVGKLLVITINGKTYYRDIETAVGNMITFTALEAAVKASVTLNGSGDDIYTGGVTIQAKDTGAAGNAFSIELVAGAGESAILGASYADNVITITSATDAAGAAQPIYAGDIQSLINNTVGINETFEAPGEIIAGAIELTAEPVPFTGGSDGVSVTAGTRYYIANDNDISTQIAAKTSNDFLGGTEKLASAETVKTLNENKLDKGSNSDLIAFTDETGKIQATNVKGALLELSTIKSDNPTINTAGDIELSHNTIYRRGELSAITFPSITPEPTHISIVEFTSGETPTTVTDASGAKWTGDSVVFSDDAYAFVPLANMRYNISFTYDGEYLVACVVGYGVEAVE